MQLSYDYGFSKNQYNGNIAGTIWKSKGSGEQRAYGFDYDNANRLLKADFTQNNSGWNNSAGIDFSMKMGDGINHQTAYDANGNIKAMMHKGLLGITSSTIDQLTYNYKNNETSNQLLNVTDAVTTQTNLGDFKNGINTSDDYGYDANGNLVFDGNKAISNISYNHLNLPQTITVTGKGTITYTYDAAGNKLQKQTIDNTTNPAKTATTDYINGFVYETANTTLSKLQFFGHEEGRVRAVDNDGLTNYVYDYFVKDHLGNTRVVLTDQNKVDNYIATNEPVRNDIEEQFFINRINLVNKPECFDSDESNSKVQLLGKADEIKPILIGEGIVLKVMAGDVVNASVKAWASEQFTSDPPNMNIEEITQLLAGLFSSGLTHIAESRSILSAASTNSVSGILDFLVSVQEKYRGGGAFLNWILLDEEQLKLVSNSSGSERYIIDEDDRIPGTCDELMVLSANNGEGINITKNGYLYIYVSNTHKSHSVFFDDLSILHTRSSLMEETHYYPFGLVMSGISSKAAGGLENRKKYNGNELQEKEFSDGSGLDFYDFNARSFDQQIGRFLQIDPDIENDQESFTPYHFTFDNPIRYNDVDGREPEDIIIKGKNNSSITIKTDLIDVSINAGSLVGDFGGNYTLEGDDILEAGLDIVGVVDPTGIADVASATLQADKGNWGGAFLSGLGVIPYIGDIAKVGKIPKHVKTINKAIDIVSSSGKKIDPKTMQKVGPSGKATVHTVKHATEKRAKDAARQGGKGTPVKHTKDKKGGKHYHHGSGVKGKGKDTKGYGSKSGKVSDNVHHEYN